MFNIIYNDTLSLKQLLLLKDEGCSILRSAHVGNWNKQTLALAKMGFKILMHEHLNVNSKVYEPSFQKKLGKKIKISDNKDDNLLQLYDNNITLSCNNKYSKPSQYHYDSLKKLYSNNIELISDYFIENELFLKKIVDILLPFYLSEFSQYLDELGNKYILKKCEKNGDLVYDNNNKKIYIKKNEVIQNIFTLFNSTSKCLKSGTNDNPFGILMSSKMYLFLTCICEINFLQNKKNLDINSVNLYHFSGTQMINYLIKNRNLAVINEKFLDDAYKLVYEKLDAQFPTIVNFNLIPTDILQFISCLKKKNNFKMELIYKKIMDIESLKNQIRMIKTKKILDISKKLLELNNQQLIEIYNENKKFISKNKQKFLELLLSDIQENKNNIVSELSNQISKQDKKFMCKIKNSGCLKDEMELDLNNIINNNLELFFEDVSQYDILSNDDIYISELYVDLSFRYVKKITKVIADKRFYNKNDK